MASSSQPNVFAAILAGGSGTRFWPLSRAAKPKQFLQLLGGTPLITQTFRRLRGVCAPSRTIVVCGARHTKSVRAALPTLPPENILVEPVARNTAPAIALATVWALSRNPSAVVVATPADHYVADVPAFRRALWRALPEAAKGFIVTLGIRPTRAETGFGYIRVGRRAGGARKVSAFVEKPDARRAAQYVASGNYLWNAGIFVFSAETMMQEIATHLPSMYQHVRRIRDAWGTPAQATAVVRAFKEMESVSIDYGVGEKSESMRVVACDCGWSDIGSFAALLEVGKLDRLGNLVRGAGALAVDSRGCVILGHTRPLVVVGMDNVVAVDGGDAILVVPVARAQEVRRAVDALSKRGLSKYL